MKKPKTLEKFYKKAEEYMSVEDEAPRVQKTLDSAAAREGERNGSRIEQKNDLGQKRGNDERNSTTYKKTRLYNRLS